MTDSWTQDPQVRDDPALRAYLDELASTAQEPVDPAVRASTLQAMLTQAARRHRAAPQPRPTWQRRLRRVLALTGVKAVLASGVAVAATGGGLAVTGTLPEPVQQFAHEVGSAVGLPIPAPPGHAEEADDDPDSTGRDHAPGQQDRPDTPAGPPDDLPADDAPGQHEAPAEPPGQQNRPDTPAGPPDDLPADEGPGRLPDEAPDGSGNAPGHNGHPPGRDDGPAVQTSTEASDDSPETSGAPGRSGSAPGQPAPPPGRGGERPATPGAAG